MALLEPRGGTDVYDPRSGGPALYQGGTFTGNALSLAAGIATMSKLDQPTIDALNDTGDTVRGKLAAALTTAPVPATVTGTGSLFHLHVGPAAVRRFRDTWQVQATQQHELFLGLLNRGAIIAPRGMGCISVHTSAADIEFFVDAVTTTLMAVESD